MSEATIKDYQTIIKTKLAEKTVKTYISFLNKLEKNTGKTMVELLENQNEIDEYINNLPNISDKTRNDKSFIVKSFISNLNLDVEYKHGLQKVTSQQKVVDVTLEDIKLEFNKVKDTIPNKNHRLLLSLLLNYDTVLRCDLSNVKINKTGNDPYVNHSDKTIVFPKNSCNKIPNKSEITLKLTESDYSLIDSSGEYLIKISIKDRCNGYSVLVSQISEKYLGKKLSQNSWRHLHSTHQVNFIDVDFIEKYKKLKEMARLKNHSIDVMLEYYVDKVEKRI